MKKFMIGGGLFGFLIGIVSGYVESADWASILWRSSVATVLAGLLLRWWAKLWVNTLHEVCRRKAADGLEPDRLPASLPSKS